MVYCNHFWGFTHCRWCRISMDFSYHLPEATDAFASSVTTWHQYTTLKSVSPNFHEVLTCLGFMLKGSKKNRRIMEDSLPWHMIRSSRTGALATPPYLSMAPFMASPGFQWGNLGTLEAALLQDPTLSKARTVSLPNNNAKLLRPISMWNYVYNTKDQSPILCCPLFSD